MAIVLPIQGLKPSVALNNKKIIIIVLNKK